MNRTEFRVDSVIKSQSSMANSSPALSLLPASALSADQVLGISESEGRSHSSLISMPAGKIEDRECQILIISVCDSKQSAWTELFPSIGKGLETDKLAFDSSPTGLELVQALLRSLCMSPFLKRWTQSARESLSKASSSNPHSLRNDGWFAYLLSFFWCIEEGLVLYNLTPALTGISP